jgi:hypothetical protein
MHIYGIITYQKDEFGGNMEISPVRNAWFNGNDAFWT